MDRKYVFSRVRDDAYHFEDIMSEMNEIFKPRDNEKLLYTRFDLMTAFIAGGMHTYDHYAKVGFEKRASDNIFSHGGLLELLMFAKSGKKFKDETDELMWTYKWLADHWHDLREVE